MFPSFVDRLVGMWSIEIIDIPVKKSVVPEPTWIIYMKSNDMVPNSRRRTKESVRHPVCAAS